MNLANQLKAKQKEQNLSNKELASAIGVSNMSLVGVLSGKSKPNATTAAKYAKYLNIDLGALPAPKKTSKKQKSHKYGGRVGKGKSYALSGSLSPGAEAIQLLSDPLAWQVHKLPSSKRQMIKLIIGA